MPSPSRLVYNISVVTRLASIDIGSNTLRLLIGEFLGGRIREIYADRKITRLGNMVDKAGSLQPDNWALSVKALGDFSSMIRRYGVRHVIAVATSALREARDAPAFIREVREKTGIHVHVISGEKEAQLNLKGILHAFSESQGGISAQIIQSGKRKNSDDDPRHPLFIMDIGGGSSEWILYQGATRYCMGSIPSGVIKMSQKCITTDPVSDADMALLRREIGIIVQGLSEDIAHLISVFPIFIGTGGTFTTLASVDLRLRAYSREKIHLHRIPLPKLYEMQGEFIRLPLSERRKIQGLEPERADLIIPGLLFTMKVMECFRFHELMISDYGLLEGALLEMKEAIEEGFSEARKP